ncbi:indole-3-glycerol phosphate synthase TrpC [Helicobacter sp. MIT 14-3879]|uniref:indole-3-glycerol phosphate synthase TrpC n=1 Tax=Helicobacter sp. MIT 14-3879 TaxID=2040649 RepID=UPI000E1EF597|nr:indole-3-glycerol phosphate synthase TrpC [Helicobacter sp. MIT 14-3879]RDU62852.1 indole-3-glycerol phosphate synthase TrpC [Helicobacter sp. MIT 14-3879]
MNILDRIIETTRERISKDKKAISLNQIREIAESKKDSSFLFQKAISKKGLNFICEVKKASPSKGMIVDEFSPKDIALEYQNIGVDAISCLTEPHYFMGKDEYLREIKECVNIPILRKDFIIDEYMIYQAKALKANAILLIAAILDKNKLKDYLSIANSLGLCVLVETHNEAEIANALFANANIIGVNNRDLKTFKVDIQTSLRLKKILPNDIIFVSESGITTRKDILELEKINTNAVLIGEWLMTQSDRQKALQILKGIL